MSNTTPNQRGGQRTGAGRKKGTGPYGQPTQPIRVPVSLLPTIKALLASAGKRPSGLTVLPFTEHPSKLSLLFFAGKVAAGFPSPADDYVEKTLDLNELLVQKPAATFFVRAEGESMLGAGIHPNDILIVDRSIEPVPGKIVICALNGELTVKRLEHDGKQWQLKAENPAYSDIAIYEELDMVIWGVVTNVIHSV
jgi:DNA polymerase V